MLFLSLFIFWIILNAELSFEIMLLGLFLCLAVYILSLKLLRKSLKDDFAELLHLPCFLLYFSLLIYEIILSSLYVIKVVLSPKLNIDPGLVEFEAGLKKKKVQYFYATSITLTPSTYSVGLRDGIFYVHYLDRRRHDHQDCTLREKLKEIEGKLYD